MNAAETTDQRAGSARAIAPRPLLEVDDLQVSFPVGKQLLPGRTKWVRAVDGATFRLAPSRTLGLVGESGSGKTTTARSVVGVLPPSAGTIRLDGKDLYGHKGRPEKSMRRRIQMVFQDPYASLDPRQRIRNIIAEPLRLHEPHRSLDERRRRLTELLELVGLDPTVADRHPHELSGGQRQRVGIARALAARPELIVCDEPVSSLDVSIQAQVLNLFKRLQSEIRLSYLFIAHDLAVVHHVAHEVAVMYLGRLVEIGVVDDVFAQPGHPYTLALMSMRPTPDREEARSRGRIVLQGEIPSPLRVPTGCRFHTRCWLWNRLGNPEICRTHDPALTPMRSTQSAACHFADRVADHWGSTSAATGSRA
jgi:oligopeptide/dipeptide ABC transporter ATP-binding protein